MTTIKELTLEQAAPFSIKRSEAVSYVHIEVNLPGKGDCQIHQREGDDFIVAMDYPIDAGSEGEFYLTLNLWRESFDTPELAAAYIKSVYPKIEKMQAVWEESGV